MIFLHVAYYLAKLQIAFIPFCNIFKNKNPTYTCGPNLSYFASMIEVKFIIYCLKKSLSTVIIANKKLIFLLQTKAVNDTFAKAFNANY